MPTKLTQIATSAIVDKLKNLVGEDVILTDLQGNVLADSQNKYFGENIPVCQQVIQKNKALYVPASQIGEKLPAWAMPLTYDDQMIGCLIIKDDQKKFTPEQLSMPRSIAELLIHQTLVLRNLPTTSQVIDKFFYDLLETESDNSNIIEQSRFLDTHYYKINVESDRVVILVNIKGFRQKVFGRGLVAESEHARVLDYKSKLIEIFQPYCPAGKPGIIVVFPGNDNFIVLIKDQYSASQTLERLSNNLSGLADIIKDKLQEEIKVTAGPFYPGLAGMIRAYRETKQLLLLGSKLYPEENVYLEKGLVIPYTLNQIPLAEQKRYLEQLEPLLKRPKLLRSLEVYFSSNLSLKETAGRLGIHKNTLYYRFQKVKRVIGLDPQQFYNSMRISLAILIHKMHRENFEQLTSSKKNSSKVSVI